MAIITIAPQRSSYKSLTLTNPKPEELRDVINVYARAGIPYRFVYGSHEYANPIAASYTSR